jgi:hypothetical protein
VKISGFHNPISNSLKTVLALKITNCTIVVGLVEKKIATVKNYDCNFGTDYDIFCSFITLTSVFVRECLDFIFRDQIQNHFRPPDSLTNC